MHPLANVKAYSALVWIIVHLEVTLQAQRQRRMDICVCLCLMLMMTLCTFGTDHYKTEGMLFNTSFGPLQFGLWTICEMVEKVLVVTNITNQSTEALLKMSLLQNTAEGSENTFSYLSCQ